MEQIRNEYVSRVVRELIGIHMLLIIDMDADDASSAQRHYTERNWLGEEVLALDYYLITT